MKEELTDSLIQSSIALQKKTAELLETTIKLNKRIDKLLDVFESAAKAIEKGEVEEPLAKKLEVLLDQNKNIARGFVRSLHGRKSEIRRGRRNPHRNEI